MPRLVVPRVPGVGQLRAESINGLQADRYKDRLIKYIPIETVAFYTVVDRLLASHYGIVAGGEGSDSLPSEARVLAWAFIVLGLIGTPAYMWRMKLKDQPWVLNATLATFAFAFWAYALGGTVFVINNWYSTFAAGLIAPIFTFVAGVFEPKA